MASYRAAGCSKICRPQRTRRPAPRRLTAARRRRAPLTRRYRERDSPGAPAHSHIAPFRSRHRGPGYPEGRGVRPTRLRSSCTLCGPDDRQAGRRPRRTRHRTAAWNSRSDNGPFLGSSNALVAKTINRVVVHHAHRLHEGITDRRTDELEASRQEIAAQGVGLRRAAGTCGACASDSPEALRRQNPRGKHRNSRTRAEPPGTPSHCAPCSRP